jgi:hypothetical protein
MDLVFLLCRHLGAEAVVLSATKEAREVWECFGFRPCERPKKRDPVRLEALYLATFG